MPRCPECGQPFDPDDASTTSPTPEWPSRRGTTVAIVLAVALTAGVVVLLFSIGTAYSRLMWGLMVTSASITLAITAAKIGAAVWFYRWLRVPTAAWLAGYWVAGVLIWPVDMVVRRSVQAGALERIITTGFSTWTLGEILMLITFCDRFLHLLSAALITLMIISEAVCLAQKVQPRPPSRLLALVQWPREHATTLGLLLIATAVMPTGFWVVVILWWG